MNTMIEKIHRGLNLPKGMKILHTSPHHDDEMLSYYPILQDLVANNQNTFVYITSGHHSVTDNYMFMELYATPEHSITFPPKRKSFLDLVAIAFATPDLYSLRDKVHWLKTVYFPNKKPGEHDSLEVSVLKGSIRELEAEKMLSQLHVDPSHIQHMRAQFYDGGDPEVDAVALKSLIEEIQPDIITVAFDPKDVGPKTHYTSLQVIERSIELSSIKPKIWHYRNVWSRFTIEEANLLIPVSEERMEAMNKAFLSCFQTQTIAAFPPQNFLGPFSKLAEKIQKEQFNALKDNLGEDFFRNHPDPRIRNARGFIFIQEV